MSLGLIKIGNSEISLKIENNFFRCSSNIQSLRKLMNLKEWRKAEDLRWMSFASVVPLLSTELKKICKKKGVDCKEIRLKHIPFQFAYRGSLGIDRALNIFAGAQEFLKAQRESRHQKNFKWKSFGVLDLGTAITFDFVDSKLRHQGGWILPGPKLQALALSFGTAQLPTLKNLSAPLTDLQMKKSYFSILGRSTTSCMEWGIRQNLIAILERAQFFCQTQRAQLYVTGGWASRMELRPEVRIIDDLIFRAMSELVSKREVVFAQKAS